MTHAANVTKASKNPSVTKKSNKSNTKRHNYDKITQSKWKDKTKALKTMVSNSDGIKIKIDKKLKGKTVLSQSVRDKKVVNASGISIEQTYVAKSEKSHQVESVLTGKGAYTDLSDYELIDKTKLLLQITHIGNFTAGQAHEAGKQILALSKRYTKQSSETADHMLRRLVDEKNAGNSNVKPSLNLFHSVMIALIKSNQQDGYQKAADLVPIMLEVFVKTPSNSKQIGMCLIAVINGCSKAKTKAAADLSLDLFLKLGNLDLNVGGVLKLFNTVLNMYSSINDHKSVFELWKRVKDNEIKGIKPNCSTHNIMIKSLVGTNSITLIKKAEEILNFMEESCYSGDISIAPDRMSFTLILSAWSRIGLDYDKAIEKAENYLMRMQQLYKNGLVLSKPDRITYNTVLNIIANSKSRTTGAKALQILEKMELLYECGDNTVRPSTASYNAVIKAFSNNVEYDGATRALMILKKLENDENLKPDIISYNTVLSAFAKSKDPIAAQVLLDNMEQRYNEGSNVRPDTVSYNTVMYAWSVSQHRRSAEIVETIFDRMETSGMRLDTTSFNTLLGAWGRQKDEHAAERATDILHHMFAVKQSGQYDVKPTTQSFAIAINAWAKSKDPRKAFRARELLLEMRTKYKNGNKLLKPNPFIYATILNACAFSHSSDKAKTEALDVAINTFKECVFRNDIVYGAFIKACSMILGPDDHRKMPLIESAFLECQKCGQVSNFVLQEIYTSVPMPFYETLLQRPRESVLTVSDVAPSWSSNVSSQSNM